MALRGGNPTRSASGASRVKAWRSSSSLAQHNCRACLVRRRYAQTEQAEAVNAPSHAGDFHDVVIVGGGPAGLVASLMLANNGFNDVCILEGETRVDASITTKGFMFSIWPHGKDTMKKAGLVDIDDQGLAGNENTPQKLTVSGEIEDQAEAAIFGSKDIPKADQNSWISRQKLIALLHDTVTARKDAIQVRMGTKLKAVDLPSGKAPEINRFTLHLQGHEGQTDSMRCRLLIAADGLKSAVRQALADAQPGEGWDMVKLWSDSANLAYKVLPVSANPQFCSTAAALENPRFVTVEGQAVDGDYPLRLGLLPLKDPAALRTVNIILRPEHRLWTIHTPEAFFAYLQQAFPQADRIRDCITPDNVQRFLDAPSSRFCRPQMCSRLAAVFGAPGDAGAAKADDAVVIVLGDAAHAFPPDLGQGVNSSMIDVDVLEHCIKAHPGDLGAAALAFEKQRLPENRALIELQTFAAPYQYKQEGTQLQRALWLMNLILRLGLSKVAPFAFHQPAVFQMVNYKVRDQAVFSKYSKILEMEQVTTRNMMVLGVSVVAAVVFVSVAR